MFDLSNPDLTTYTSADGTLNGPHTAREIRSFSGTPWCIRFDGVNYTSVDGFYIQWDQTAANAVYINENVGATGAWLVYNQPYQQVYVWPPNVTPAAPPTPTPPPRPTGMPDLPAGTDCSAADLQSLCEQIQDLASDLQHVFAALASATDQRATNQTDLDERLTTIATGVSTNAGQLTTLHSDVVAADADIQHLFPLVDDDISAMLGCPPSEVTGKLLAFLPAAFHALPAGCPPATDILASVGLVAGDNAVDLPAGTAAVRIEISGIPGYWGYLGLDPRRYETLGYASTVQAGGKVDSHTLQWAQQTVVIAGAIAPTTLVVNLLPPMTGTAVVLGSA